MSIREEAVKMHGQGYNCAQCVLKACREFYPEIDDNALSRVASGFGGGVCCGEICGALTGAVMALGLAYGFDDSTPLESKERSKGLIKECNEDFVNRFKSLLCRELKGGEFSCNELIGYAAELSEKMIKNLD